MYSIKTIIIIKLLFISCILSINQGFSLSSVNREYITDQQNDWNVVYNESNCRLNLNEIKIPEIEAISYQSNGEFLNATLWLSSSNLFPPNDHMLSYEMIIDVTSINDSPMDYQYIIMWDHLGQKKWTLLLDEISMINENTKNIINLENYSDFFDRGKPYINFGLDLKKIGNPQEFSLLFLILDFYQTDEGVTCAIADNSDRIIIPPPTFNIKSFPNPVTLRPGETQQIEIELSTNSTGFDPIVHLYLKEENITTNFLTNNFSMPSLAPYANIFAPLEISLPDDVDIRPYSLPIFANASFHFPDVSENKGYERIENFTKTPFGEARLKVLLDKSNFAPVSNQEEIKLIVEKPLTFSEKFGIFWDVYGGIIGVISGGLASGGFIVYIFSIIQKKKKIDNLNRQDNN